MTRYLLPAAEAYPGCGATTGMQPNPPLGRPAGTAVTKAVYRKELRLVLTDGADVIGSIFTRRGS